MGGYVEEGGVKLRHGSGKFDDGIESYDGQWAKDAMDGKGASRC